MNDLISQLLGLARWDSDAESRQEESISLADLVQEVAADADYEATSQNRRVSVLESEDCIVTVSQELLRSASEKHITKTYVRRGPAPVGVKPVLRAWMELC